MKWLQRLGIGRQGEEVHPTDPLPESGPNDPSVIQKPLPPETPEKQAGRDESKRDPLERYGDALEEYGRSVEKGEPPDYDKL